MAAGDFNMGPSKLDTTDFAARTKCVFVVPKRATCLTKTSSSIIDFGFVSQQIADLITEVAVLEHWDSDSQASHVHIAVEHL